MTDLFIVLNLLYHTRPINIYNYMLFFNKLGEVDILKVAPTKANCFICRYKYKLLPWLLHFFSLVWLHVLTTLEIFASCGPEGKGPEFENLNRPWYLEM